MRNIQHHVLIITCNDRNTLELIRQKAAELFKTYMEASSGSKLLTEIKESLINNYFTFFIIPDGSKEGYDASDDGDIIRQKLIEHLKTVIAATEFHLSYAELAFGGDDGKAAIINYH